MPDVSPTRDYDRDKFTPRMALACDLAATGRSNSEIAEILDVTESTVSIWLGDARAHEYLRTLREKISDAVPDVMERLHFVANEALDTAIEVMRDSSASAAIRAKVSFGLLDRAGYTPVQKVLRGQMPAIPADLASRMEETLDETKEITARFHFSASEVPPDPELDGTGS